MCLNRWKVIGFKMADLSEFLKKHSQYKTTFKVTSYDDKNSVYLCLDEQNITINFDALVADIYPDSNSYRPKTFDSIYIDKNDIYCIEFKNEKKPDKRDLASKLVDGKNELDRLLAELNIQKDEYRFIFCLVYNIHKPKHDRFKRGIISYPIKAYLQKYKEDGFIDDLFTEDVDFFSKKFRKKIKRELDC